MHKLFWGSIKYRVTLASKIGVSYIDELMADLTPTYHKVAVPQGIVGPGIKNRNPPCAYSNIPNLAWVWNEAATTSYSSSVTSTALDATRWDPCFGHVLMQSRSSNKNWWCGAVSLSYEVVVCTYTALWWSPSNGMFFILWGFRTKIAKRHIAPPHCIKLQLTWISCSLVGDFFHFSILLETPCRDK